MNFVYHIGVLKRADLACYAALIAIPLVLGAPTLVGLAALGPDRGWDADPLYAPTKRDDSRSFDDYTPMHVDYPRDMQLARRWHAGHFDGWNPYAGAGSPLWAEQAGPYFPLRLLHYLAPSKATHNLFLLSRLCLAGIGAYVLARSYGRSRRAALASGVIFQLSGAMVSLVAFSAASAPALLPWSIWGARLLASRADRWRGAFVSSIVLAGAALGGHPTLDLVPMIGFVFALAGELLHRRAQGESLEGFIPALASVVGVSVALSAATLLPFAELFHVATSYKDDARAQYTYDWALEGLRDSVMAGLAWPGASWLVRRHWDSYPRDLVPIVGVITLVLALSRRPREPAISWVFVSAFFALGATFLLPVALPIYFAALWALPIAMWAGAALDEEPRRIVTRLRIVVPVVAVLFVIIEHVRRYEPHEYLSLFLRQDPEFIVSALLPWGVVAGLIAIGHRVSGQAVIARWLAVACAVELGLVMFPHLNRQRSKVLAAPPAPAVQFLESRLANGQWRFSAELLVGHPMTPMLYQLRDFRACAALAVKRFADYPAVTTGTTLYATNLDSRFIDRAAVRYIVTERGSDQDRLFGNHYPEIFRDGRLRVLENARAVPRFRVVHRWTEVADAKTAKASLKEDGDLGEVIVEPSASGAHLPAPAGSVEAELAARERIEWVTDDPDAIELRAHLERPGLLVVADTYYPGWRARVDGKPADIFPVDLMFRGVAVDAGDHRVELEYAPRTAKVALAAFLVGIIGLVRMRRRIRSTA
jgi:hypothetical protein